MEFLNENLNANDNNIPTDLYDFLGEPILSDTFGNPCLELGQEHQISISSLTEAINSESNNEQNSINIVLDTNLNDETNSKTLISNGLDLNTNYSSQKLSGEFSGRFHANNNDQTRDNFTILSSKTSVHSDNDSDSGICSSSVSCHSGLSPKDTFNPLAIHEEPRQIYLSNVSSVIDLENSKNDLVDQLISADDLQHFNKFDLQTELANDNLDGLLINKTDENVNTELLLDSIEQMLKSMEDPTQNKQIDNNSNTNLTKSKHNRDKLIKIEPYGRTIKNNTSIKKSLKILPKLSPKTPTSQPRGNIIQMLQPGSTKSPIVLPIINEGLINSNQLNIFKSENVSNLNSYDGSSNKKIKKDTFKLEPTENKLDLENAIIDLSPKAYSLSNNLSNNNISEKMDSNNNSKQQEVNTDPSITKKQSRMIKNRESACLSRKRKKEYVQTLEESIQNEKKINEKLRAENQKMKDRILVLETENNLLREQHRVQVKQGSLSIDELELEKQKMINLNSNRTNSASMKRPFIMMAVFIVFGLNIFQFININFNNSQKTNNIYDTKKIQYTPSQLAAALAEPDGLIDLPSPLQSHIKSRNLLSDDYEYSDELETLSTKRKIDENNVSHVNLTKSKNESNMELVLINGTWHMVDLNICYKIMSLNATENDSRFYDHSHFKKINSELNMWFEQHVKIIKNSQNQKDSNRKFASALWTEFMKEKQKNIQLSIIKNQPSRLKSLQNKRNLRAIESVSDRNIYPVSIYDTQSRLYENFARTVRTRDDTLYYISFRRDHVIFPAINQNKTRRPKVSLIVPSMLNAKKPLDESSDSTFHENDKKLFQFIRIDCEVFDTKLFYLNPDDIPHDYMKILRENVQNGFNH